jgi:hypothetical protein
MASIITSDMLKAGKSILSAKSIAESGSAERKREYYVAERLLEKAKERLAKGSREAKEIGRQGQVMESDAIAAMGGMGMVTDPVLLAKIRAKSSYNALAALFEADVGSDDLRQQAIDTRYSADMSYAANVSNVAAASLTGVKTLGDSFGDWMKKKRSSVPGPH